MSFIPAFMTERDELAVRDCGGSSGLMLANKATRGAYPTTRAEREALLRAAGTTESHEGVSVLTLRKGMTKHFGWTPRILEGTGAQMLAALWPGVGAAVFGYYAKLPVHFQRFDPHFAAKGDESYHVIYVQRETANLIRILDPLHAPDTSYKGEYIPPVALQAYATGYGSPARMLYEPEGSHAGLGNAPQEEPAVRYIKSEGFDGKLINVGDDHPWFTLDGQPGGVIGKASALHVVGLVDGKAGQWAVEIGSADSDVSPSGKSQRVVVLVQSTNDPYPAPAASSDIKVAVNAALDHVAPLVRAVDTAISEARIR